MAAASVRLAAPSLARMFDTCTLAVFGVMNSSAPISRFDLPLTSRLSTSRSRSVSAPIGFTPACADPLPFIGFSRARRARSSSAA
ncbi:MAG: hypothetical protein ACRDNS_16895, partial [Trebonia sp.]